MNVDLSWFGALAMADQVTLLRDPHGPLARELAFRIAASLGEQLVLKRQVIVQDKWASGQPCWRLAEPTKGQLSDVRQRLDAWWNSDSLSERERRYLIDHRADDELPPRAVRVEPLWLRAYLEMKAHTAPPL